MADYLLLLFISLIVWTSSSLITSSSRFNEIKSSLIEILFAFKLFINAILKLLKILLLDLFDYKNRIIKDPVNDNLLEFYSKQKTSQVINESEYPLLINKICSALLDI